jgi:hypothetical protein
MKHSLQSASTEEGIQIDESDEHSENAERPIDDSLQPAPNVIVDSDWHLEKHPTPSFCTVDGMQIEESETQPTHAELSMHESRDPDSKMTVERN